MFERVLIANRGEIARRIQATCRVLGIETVAVYSDADADAGFVHAADVAVRLGPPPAAQSYLQQRAILDAARATGAQAIHPGYGFLAENARFARAVEDAGLTFVGPAAQTIALMGSKVDAKRAMEKAGVPCIPGYHGEAQDDATLRAEAERIGWPVLIKASAGGGGKGMRVVRDPARFTEACAAARREARSAFDDDVLLLEKYIERPRHIEVQVFGDAHGNVVHLFERECSVQRRYQKIIEEAPSPVLDAQRRAAMTDTAVRAARAVGYRNAGTIEFIVAPDGEFYFMEMNTRLQVEHPVTEMVTGVDLVAWQLRVAAGEALPLAQDDIALRGHAIEARVYAEDPYNGFLPASGTLTAVRFEREQAARVDADLHDGQVITPYYDPMIAKLSVHRDSRTRACDALRAVLDGTTLAGPATNLPLLRRLLRHPDFLEARIDTGYLDRHLADVLGSAAASPEALAAAAAAILAAQDPSGSPWAADGWRSGGGGQRRFAFTLADGTRALCSAAVTGRRVTVTAGDATAVARAGRVEPDGALAVAVVHDGVRRDAHVVAFPGGWRVMTHDGALELREAPLYPVERDARSDAEHPGAPMPGKVVKVLVAEGDRVTKGQGLIVMEGMKMEVTVAAAMDATVARVLCAEGDQVEAEAVLVDLTEE